MYSRNRLIQSACVLVLAAVVAGACNTQASGVNGLANTEWLLGTMEASPIASGANITLAFGLRQASGFGGCNQFNAGYETDGSSQLSFGPIASTRMACDAPTNAAETKYFANLSKVVKYSIVAGTLTLRDRSNTVVLTYGVAPEATVEGPWTVTAVNNGQGAVASVPSGVSAAVSFLPDGTVEGFGGCNNFSGVYTLGSGAVQGSISIGPLMSTQKACAEPAGTFEVQFLTALQKSSRWAVSGGKLDLRDSEGAQQVAAQSAIGH